MTKLFETIQPAHIEWLGGVPYAPLFDDVYYTNQNGLEESMVVFIQGNQLIDRFRNMAPYATFVIGEFGFGTGLNCLLAWQLFMRYAPDTAKLRIYSTEKYPLKPEDLMQALSSWPSLAVQSQQLIEHYPLLTAGVHPMVFEQARVCIHLMLGEAVTCFKALSHHPVHHVHAWFLDGFSPAKNNRMWQQSVYDIMADYSYPEETTVGTFSVAATVKQGLQKAGFCIEKKPGFSLKRHRLQAYFKPSTAVPHHIHFVPSTSKRVTILGAGLAGCFCAHWLAKLGFEVTILDENTQVAQQASFNPRGILYPNISQYDAPLTQWMMTAHAFSVQIYKPWLKRGLVQGEMNGIIELACSQKIIKKQDKLQNWIAHIPDLAQYCTSAELSRRAGVHIQQSGLWIPQAGWLNIKNLCQFLVAHPRINCQFSRHIDHIIFDKSASSWSLKADDITHDAKTLILASPQSIHRFKETEHLPLRPIGGQLSAISSSPQSSSLKIPICGLGHFLPADEVGMHWFGATYAPGQARHSALALDDEKNLSQLDAMGFDFELGHIVHGSWANTRYNTTDYLPLVGTLCERTQLWSCTGFGSRGLLSIPLASYYLAQSLDKNPFVIPEAMRQAIAPSRFVHRYV